MMTGTGSPENHFGYSFRGVKWTVKSILFLLVLGGCSRSRSDMWSAPPEQVKDVLGFDGSCIGNIVSVEPTKYVVEKKADCAPKIVPAFEKEVAVGFMVLQIPKDHILRRLGLLDGDVIESINNTRLTDLSKLLEAYSNLRNETRFSVVLRRAKKPVTFEYELRRSQ